MSAPVQLSSHGNITEVAIQCPNAFNAFDMDLLTQEFHSGVHLNRAADMFIL
jgi:hypothetical protein